MWRNIKITSKSETCSSFTLLAVAYFLPLFGAEFWIVIMFIHLGKYTVVLCVGDYLFYQFIWYEVGLNLQEFIIFKTLFFLEQEKTGRRMTKRALSIHTFFSTLNKLSTLCTLKHKHIIICIQCWALAIYLILWAITRNTLNFI